MKKSEAMVREVMGLKKEIERRSQLEAEAIRLLREGKAEEAQQLLECKAPAADPKPRLQEEPTKQSYRLTMNKTKFYRLMEHYSQELPSQRNCEYSCHEGCYWMNYRTPGDDVPVCVTACAVMGGVTLRFVRRSYDSEVPDTCFLSERIPYEVLTGYGLLREIAA